MRIDQLGRPSDSRRSALTNQVRIRELHSGQSPLPPDPQRLFLTQRL